MTRRASTPAPFKLASKVPVPLASPGMKMTVGPAPRCSTAMAGADIEALVVSCGAAHAGTAKQAAEASARLRIRIEISLNVIYT
ncbi:MAG TPA: hypothetical protein DEA50_14815 [Parvularcula sp.]|nr:hypothetical protein [Parvularcula sp.]